MKLHKLKGVVFKPNNSYDFWFNTFGVNEAECLILLQSVIKKMEYETDEQYRQKILELGELSNVSVEVTVKL